MSPSSASGDRLVAVGKHPHARGVAAVLAAQVLEVAVGQRDRQAGGQAARPQRLEPCAERDSRHDHHQQHGDRIEVDPAGGVLPDAARQPHRRQARRIRQRDAGQEAGRPEDRPQQAADRARRRGRCSPSRRGIRRRGRGCRGRPARRARRRRPRSAAPTAPRAALSRRCSAAAIAARTARAATSASCLSSDLGTPIIRRAISRCIGPRRAASARPAAAAAPGAPSSARTAISSR